MKNRQLFKAITRSGLFKNYSVTQTPYPMQPAINHYVVAHAPGCTVDSIHKEIVKMAKSANNSIVFLTQKSRALVTNRQDNEHPGRPATKEELSSKLNEISVKSVQSNMDKTRYLE
jgi:hypothetical protein